MAIMAMLGDAKCTLKRSAIYFASTHVSSCIIERHDRGTATRHIEVKRFARIKFRPFSTSCLLLV